jgi:hypothetical protein
VDGGGSLVRAGAPTLNQWRNAHSNETIAVSGEIFVGLDLSGSNLKDANLKKCHFIDCDLKHVNFENSALDHSTFTNCNLSHSIFSRARLRKVAFDGVDLSGSQFIDTRHLGRLQKLSIKPISGMAPTYNSDQLPWIDKWIGWDRLRFLSTLRIFVPAYFSLALSVLTLESVSWLNASIDKINTVLGRTIGAYAPFVPALIPGWTHIAVIINFLLLALAATTFLGCPARVTEFTRERWLFEFGQPELLYAYSTWQRPWLRFSCALSLATGGVLSIFLLSRAIIQQIYFISSHIS